MRTVVVGAVLAVALVLPGCSAERQSDYPVETVITLQGQVLEITTAAAAGDPALAMVRLNELAAITNDALVRGEITEARRDSILSAILLVKSDLERAIAAAEEAERLPEEAAGSADETRGETVVDRDDRTEDQEGESPTADGTGSSGSGSSSGSSSGGDVADGSGDDEPRGNSGKKGKRINGEPDNDGPRNENSAWGDSNPGMGNKKGQGD